MDIFKFAPVVDVINLQNGDMVHGIKTVMWVERYRDSGEFTITADVDSNIRAELPVGTCISHVRSHEVMIVENHEISDAKGDDFEVTITGRSLETILEQRIIGANATFPAGAPVPYVIPANYTWLQAESLLDAHINSTYTLDQNDAFTGIDIQNSITRTNGVVEPREFKLVTLYDGLLELLSYEQLGIRNHRPMGTRTDTIFEIHEGIDKSANVIFSFDAGDITNADYLWSNKNNKNSVLVTSKWAQVMIKAPGSKGYNRRVTVFDAGEVDEHFNDPPDANQMNQIRAALTVIGNQVINTRNNIALSKAEAAKNSKKYVYRENFEVGDIVLIDGLFNESATMRVIEYVEISDKEGTSGYPTLSTYPEES